MCVFVRKSLHENEAHGFGREWISLLLFTNLFSVPGLRELFISIIHNYTLHSSALSFSPNKTEESHICFPSDLPLNFVKTDKRKPSNFLNTSPNRLSFSASCHVFAILFQVLKFTNRACNAYIIPRISMLLCWVVVGRRQKSNHLLSMLQAS